MAQPRGPKPKPKVAPPTPLKGAPEPPASLDAAVRKHWKALTGLLEEAGQLSRLDEDGLLLYLTLWSRWRKAEREIARPAEDGGGEVIVARNGYAQPSPWYTISVQCMRDMKAYLAEFGLSPKARSKLTVNPTEEVGDQWSEFDS
jgi:P27 family predicted phage terminase small subunit